MRSGWPRTLLTLLVGLQGLLALTVAGLGGVLLLSWFHDAGDASEFSDLGLGLGVIALGAGLVVGTIVLGALAAYRRGSPLGRILLFVVQTLFLVVAAGATRNTGDLRGGIVCMAVFAGPTLLLVWETARSSSGLGGRAGVQQPGAISSRRR